MVHDVADFSMNDQLDDDAGRISNVCLPRVARWMEETYGLDAHEARSVVTDAFRRYGCKVVQAWKSRAMSVGLREHNRSFRFELSLTCEAE
jgi:hypothetical protein